MAKGAYWTWNAVLRRYYLTSEGAKALGGRAGQFVGASKMRDIRDGIVTKSQQRMESIVANYIDGRMNISDMVLAMRKEAKQTAIQQWLLSSGGRNTFTHAEAGKLGAYMRTEYAKIQTLGTQIKNGEITQAQAKLYARYQASYSTSIFERAQALSRGAGDLPAYPADGTQNCRCVISPESRVLTRQGWVPISEMSVGTMVWTHKGRWRRVTAVIKKPSLSSHARVRVMGTLGNWVEATQTHVWLTPDGWLDYSGICSYTSTILHLQESACEAILSGVQSPVVKQEQSGFVSGLSVGMRLREPEGLSSRPVRSLRNEQKSKTAMGEYAAEDGRFVSECGDRAAVQIQGHHNRIELDAENGRPFLRLVLGRATKEDDLSVSVGVDNGERADPGGICNSSYQRRLLGRPSGKSVYDDARQSLTTSSAIAQGELPKNHMSAMRGSVPETTEEATPGEILFAGMLPSDTTLYDLTVDEDHSFVIEGLISHNSNCRCSWRWIEDKDRWLVVWELSSGAKHCSSCIDNSNRWSLKSPFVIMKPLLERAIR